MYRKIVFLASDVDAKVQEIYVRVTDFYSVNFMVGYCNWQSRFFMSRFESDFLPSTPYNNRVIYWYRYVDDVTCVWSGSRNELDSKLLPRFEFAIPNHVKFTLEVGNSLVHKLPGRLRLVR